jgi:predicted nuclease of predicted toxin-antitoxin system
MKFLLDENVEYRIASFLKKQGYDVTAIAHDYPNALTDRAVLAIAAEEKRILITNDRTDFRKLIFEHQLPHSGVIVLHLDTDDIAIKQQRLIEAIKLHKDHLAQHYFVIMSVLTFRLSRPKKAILLAEDCQRE